MVSDLKAKEFCFMQKKSSCPSCFKAAMALFFAVVCFISGCSVGSGTEPSSTPTSVPITQVPTTPEPENVGNGEVRDGSLVNVQPKCILDIRGLDLTNCECTVKLSKIANGNAAGGSQQPLEIILKGTINKPTEVDLSGGELFLLEIRNSGEEASNSEVYKIFLSVDSDNGRPELVFYTMYGTVSPEITVDTNVQVAAGNSVSYAITEDGSLWEWGAKCGTRLAGNAAPKKILSDIVSVSTSGNGSFDESSPEVWTHTLAVAKDGSLYG